MFLNPFYQPATKKCKKMPPSVNLKIKTNPTARKSTGGHRSNVRPPSPDLITLDSEDEECHSQDDAFLNPFYQRVTKEAESCHVTHMQSSPVQTSNEEYEETTRSDGNRSRKKNGESGSDEEWTLANTCGLSSTLFESRTSHTTDSLGGVKRSVTESQNEGSRNSFFNKQIKNVPVILESFNSKKGVGASLYPLLPQQKESCDAVAAFLMFVLERQKVWKKKQKGRRQLTQNKVLSTQWFTNMYRELDRGTMYMRHCLLQTELKDTAPSDSINHELVQRVLFKSIVYRLINKVDTFVDFGGLPAQEEYTTFEKFLACKKAQGEVIFTAAHQNMGYDR